MTKQVASKTVERAKLEQSLIIFVEILNQVPNGCGTDALSSPAATPNFNIEFHQTHS